MSFLLQAGLSRPDIGGWGKSRETNLPHLEKTRYLSCFEGKSNRNAFVAQMLDEPSAFRLAVAP